MVVLRRGASVFTHVPFIAVDSRESVVGGRVNWALPKELATFDGAPDSAMHAHGDGWEVHMDARPRGPALPWLLPPLATLTQIDATGARVVARVSGYGRARRARITVDADGGDIADWFPIGTFDGTVSRMAGYLAAAK